MDYQQRRWYYRYDTKDWSVNDQRSVILITGVLHIPFIISLINICKTQQRFHTFLIIFYNLASISYNMSSMVPGRRIYLHRTTWSKVTFIQGISLWNICLIYLMDLNEYPYLRGLYEWIQYAVIIVIQENKPGCYYWNWYPIIFHMILFILRMGYLIIYKGQIPKYNYKNLSISLGLILCGYLCLFQVKKEYTFDAEIESDDYLRIWHALCDMFIGIAFYWFWRVLPNSSETQRKQK